MIRIYDVVMCTAMRDAIQSTCVTSDFKRQGPTHYKLGCAQQLCVCMLVANYRARVCVCVAGHYYCVSIIASHKLYTISHIKF